MCKYAQLAAKKKFNEFACEFVNFVILACSDDNYQHTIVSADELINNARSGILKFDY